VPNDYRELLITDLAEENADLREANRQLVDLVADLAFDNNRLRHVFHRLLTRLDDARLDAQRDRDVVLAQQAMETA
jgi:hypothetical protein